MDKPKITIQPTDEHLKKKQRQAKLVGLDTDRKKGSLTQGDKLDIIIKQNDILVEQNDHIIELLSKQR